MTNDNKVLATPVQARAIETKKKLIDAAKVVLATKGRDSFTTSDIAEEAGVSIGILYRYFRNRVDVLDAVWPKRPGQFYSTPATRKSAAEKVAQAEVAEKTASAAKRKSAPAKKTAAPKSKSTPAKKVVQEA